MLELEVEIPQHRYEGGEHCGEFLTLFPSGSERHTLREFGDNGEVVEARLVECAFDVEDEAKRALVPSLVLQPLVENAIKYAVADREAGGQIKVRARKRNGQLLLSLEDDGPGIELDNSELPEFTGVGIEILNFRVIIL